MTILIEDGGAVFVFGSNEAGRHGAGAARTAHQKFGAVYGQGEGLYGNSYAIPTKDGQLNTLPLIKIAQYVDAFKYYAKNDLDTLYYVTRIGTGLAGWTDEDIAPMFADSPDNCIFDIAWKPWVKGKQYFFGELS